MRIGLLGGSFNPAHEGHRHVAEQVRRHLRLDQVWLLVSPGNPLKPANGMASHGSRLASASAIADGRRIVATGIETRLGTRYTFDTLRALKRRFPRARFVLIAGADLLAQLPRWKRWAGVMASLPLAVLPRPGYTYRALASRAAHRFAVERLPARAAPLLARAKPPAWLFLPVSQHAASATAIRNANTGEVPRLETCHRP
jgi:nicotinate-nucleotide adenylyltransferase